MPPPISPPPPAVPGRCYDDPTYSFGGSTCAAWTGFDCSTAPTYGYSAAETAALIYSCPIACQADPECFPPAIPPPPASPPIPPVPMTPPPPGTPPSTPGPSSPAPISPPPPSIPGRCYDDPTFFFAGSACAAWTGYDCSTAPTYGYSAAETAALIYSCPIACGSDPQCFPPATPPPPASPPSAPAPSPPLPPPEPPMPPVSPGAAPPVTPPVAPPAAPCATNDAAYAASGWTCTSWTGYDCSAAVESYGFSQTEEDALLSSCPAACGNLPVC